VRLVQMYNPYEEQRRRDWERREKEKQEAEVLNAAHGKKVESLNAEFFDFIQANQDGSFANDRLFAWACKEGSSGAYNCQKIEPVLITDKVGEVLIVRRLSVLIDEIRGLQQHISSSPGLPENNTNLSVQAIGELKEELGNSRALQSQLFSSLLQEVRQLKQTFEKHSELLPEVQELAELLPEVQELRQALRSQHYSNRSFLLGCACLGVLILLLFK